MTDAIDTSIETMPVADSWQQTFTGKKFFVTSPQLEDIDIRDIAHSLSNQCRFGGHCLKFYSVAEHCLLASYMIEAPYALWMLLHDAAEAYVIDLPRPVKNLLPDYYGLEKKVMRKIIEKFGLEPQIPEAVKITDERMLMTEAKLNMASPPEPWVTTAEPFPLLTLSYFTPQQAEEAFIHRFEHLWFETHQ